MPADIRIYSEFSKRDWPKLPETAQESLANFLLKLQSDPGNPEIANKTRFDATGRLVYEFSPGYEVHWQIVMGDGGNVQRIEVLGLFKTGIEIASATPTGENRRSDLGLDMPDVIDRVYSRTGSLGSLTMWGTLHVSRNSREIKGWIVDSWSQGGPPFLAPKLHWVSYPDYSLHHMQLNVDFRSTIGVGSVDSDAEAERIVFIRGTLSKWEKDWHEEISKKLADKEADSLE